MDFDSLEDVSAAIVTFERELERLLLESFGNGVPIEDTWEITTPISDTPNWRITIEKVYPGGTSVDGARSVEE